MLAILMAADDELRATPVFILASAETQPVPGWIPGYLTIRQRKLRNRDRRSCPIPGAPPDAGPGEVGVVAEVKVNGSPAGSASGCRSPLTSRSG